MQYQFGITLLNKTLYKIVQRISKIKSVNGIKMEYGRVQWDPELIDLFYDELKELLFIGIPSAFIINIDESGYSGWIDTVYILCTLDYSMFKKEKMRKMVVDTCIQMIKIIDSFSQSSSSSNVANTFRAWIRSKYDHKKDIFTSIAIPIPYIYRICATKVRINSIIH